MDIVADIPPQQPCNFHCSNRIRNECGVFFNLKQFRHFDYDRTASQHSHISLDMQEPGEVGEVPARFTSAQPDDDVESAYSLLDMFFSKLLPEVWPIRRGTFCRRSYT
jgi:hypothetical protein